MSETPEEPDFEALEKELDISPMDEEAMQMHELYKSLLKAGFREKAALTLVAMIVNDMHDQVYIHQIDEDEEDDDLDPDLGN